MVGSALGLAVRDAFLGTGLQVLVTDIDVGGNLDCLFLRYF